MNPPVPETVQSTTLVSKSLKGDLDAFRSLMEFHEDYAFALAYRLLHDEEDSKDVVQEAFIRVWNNLPRYRKEVKFTTWLYKIVTNLCYDRMKMDARRRRVLGFFNRSDVPDGTDVHKRLEDTDLLEYVRSAIRLLPPKERLVLQLRDLQDFSIDEIADLTDMSVASVKTNLCYARKRIRSIMSRVE